MSLTWCPGDVLDVPLAEIGESYARYRLHDASAEDAMARSLRRYGQIAPLVVCLRDGRVELIDGFKRLSSSRRLSLPTLSARLLDADDRAAKAAIFCLNRGGGRTHDLEEAWIVQALVREDGLSQVEVAELLGRHKSWVSRRLAMIERLSDRAREDLRLGLLTPGSARQLTRLPPGNQDEVVSVVRRDSLSCQELQGVVDLLMVSSDASQRQFILEKPRLALAQARGVSAPSYDPRLSAAGNRVRKRLGLLLDLLARMRNWLVHGSKDELTLSDQTLLSPEFARLSGEAASVAELAQSRGVAR
jgi:ParB-like chromosome segregation protein Spo0J